MKSYTLVPLALALARSISVSQGTFAYDQQSSTNETTIAGVAIIQELLVPYGQSFTPALSGIGFVRLDLNDHNGGNGLGATLYVNLRGDSIGGAVLSSTSPVTLADSFAGRVNFFFPCEVPLTPGVIYYFEPVVQSGDSWNVDIGEYGYPGGSAFNRGFAAGSDFWFREGVYIPEPSVGLLISVGIVAFACRGLMKQR